MKQKLKRIGPWLHALLFPVKLVERTFKIHLYSFEDFGKITKPQFFTMLFARGIYQGDKLMQLKGLYPSDVAKHLTLKNEMRAALKEILAPWLIQDGVPEDEVRVYLDVDSVQTERVLAEAGRFLNDPQQLALAGHILKIHLHQHALSIKLADILKQAPSTLQILENMGKEYVGDIQAMSGLELVRNFSEEDILTIKEIIKMAGIDPHSTIPTWEMWKQEQKKEF